MHRFIYSVLFYLAIPLLLLRLLLRSRRAPAYRQRIAERFALSGLPAHFDPAAQTIWIHAVSVGETVAAAPLVHVLQQQYPQNQILVTTMTPTGSDRVRSLFGDKVFHTYLPYDLPGVVNRFIRKVNPKMLILMETELWPNLIYQCSANGVKLVLANARLSEKSAAGYRRFANASRAMLNKFDRIAAQADADAQRFIALGASPQLVSVTGSLKFLVDIPDSGKQRNPVFDSIVAADRPVWIAASTREGEEEKVLAAFESIIKEYPELLLIIVPRHPERFDSIAALCEAHGLAVCRRSDNIPINPATSVVLGDSMGEMLEYYRLAHIAFVGGSLVDTGCQNVLEPAAMGIPVITGPSQYNFATICAQLEQAGALHTVADERTLAQFVMELLQDKDRQIRMGNTGKQLVRANQNALPALMELIDELIVN